MFNYVHRARVAETALIAAQEQLAGIEARIADRAALVSIVQQDRTLRFTFVRNGNLTVIETYSPMGLNVNALRSELLGEQ